MPIDRPAALQRTSSRALPMAGMIVLHLLCYLSVNRINDLRPATHFLNLATSVDKFIPYMGWTWALYYIGVPYMSFWAFYVMWNLPEEVFRAALRAYLAMILVGATTQLLAPARSPWPANPVPLQDFMHMRVSYDPYVCLPSMHVALSIFPACLSLHVFRSPLMRLISLLLAVLISASTVTMKEHFFLDTVAGLMLGLAAYAFSQYRSTSGRP